MKNPEPEPPRPSVSPTGNGEREPVKAEDSGIFRADFLRRYRQRSEAGAVLRVSPRWVDAAYWVVIALALGGLLYCVFGRVHEYATGPGVVRYRDRADLTARSEGTVTDVLVRPGQTVTAGQLLVRFYSGEESAELDRVEREFQLELVNLLRDPSDQDARQSMARLRADRDRTRASLEERAIRAPMEGKVSDIAIRPGQHLQPGDPVVTVLGKAPSLMLVAVIPGQFRPLLRPGLTLRLQISGYPYVHQDLTVVAIGDEIVGPGAIRRYLGPNLGDAISLTGSGVLVYADLPGHGFRWEGRERPYYDGLLGRVQVSVRDQRVLLALIPGLRALLEKTNG